MTNPIKIRTTLPDGKVSDLDLNATGNFNVLVHPQGVAIEVLNFVEISPQHTIECMQRMSEGAWRWISRGPLFQACWKEAYSTSHVQQPIMTIPDTIELLNRTDIGMRHIAGLIVLCCEAIFEGKSVFLRNPECYLHPATEQRIALMLKKLLKLAGSTMTVTEADSNFQPQNVSVPDEGPVVANPERVIEDPAKVSDLVVEWLTCKDPNRDVAQIGSKLYKPAELIIEIQHDTEIGRQMIAAYLKLAGSK